MLHSRQQAFIISFVYRMVSISLLGQSHPHYNTTTIGMILD